MENTTFLLKCHVANDVGVGWRLEIHAQAVKFKTMNDSIQRYDVTSEHLYVDVGEHLRIEIIQKENDEKFDFILNFLLKLLSFMKNPFLRIRKSIFIFW